MKVVLQRVISASVSVQEKIVGEIHNGLLILVGFTHNDTTNDIDYLVNKIINIRIFNDDAGIMNKSIMDTNGSILSISQFTLYANPNKGRRPSYDQALKTEDANILYNEFNSKLKEQGIKVQAGIFASDMKVSLINDGPVTIIIESRENND
jgi:D-tyrosyl-tRNA(Tyr) deacylase